jgi:Domain of unknown function (DUF4558)
MQSGQPRKQPAVMGKEPVNITRLKRQNDQFAAAEHHAHDLQTAGVTAQWFERDLAKPKGPEVNIHTTSFHTRPSSLLEVTKRGQLDQISQELDAANKLLSSARKQLLHKQFQAERAQHEEELNAMGLAFEKHRD